MAHLTREDIEALISELRDYKGEELLEKLRLSFPLSTDLPVQEELCKFLLELLQAGGVEVPADALTQPRLTLVNILKGKQPLECLMHGLASDVQELRRLQEGLEEKKKILLQEEIERMRRELAALDQEILSKRETAGPSWVKQEPNIQGFTEPYGPAPFPPRPEQPPLPEAPAPAPRRKSLGAMVEMTTKLIPPSERFSGKETSNVHEDLNEFEELCWANDIPQDRWQASSPLY